MYTKILVIAAVLLCFTVAATKANCATAEECKAAMKQAFKAKFYIAFSEMLDKIYLITQETADMIKTDLSIRDTRYAQLEEVEHIAHVQMKILEKTNELNDEKLVDMYLKTSLLWLQISKLNLEKKDMKAQGDRAAAEVDKIYKKVFDIWMVTGKLKGNIEMPDYEEIEHQVERVKNSNIIDKDTIRTFNKIITYYGLQRLNVFTAG